MRTRNILLTTLSAALLIAATANAAHVDMKNPKRAVGREDDIRVDAELTQDSITSHASVGVTYQVENLTQVSIALADKVSDTTYDPDTQTITVSFGAEVPNGATMPHLVVIAPGQKRTFCGGGTVNIVTPNVHGPWTPVPRFVQIKVTVLRDLKAFTGLIDQQNRSTTAPALNNQAFDQWVDNVSSVYLNSIPVRYEGNTRGTVDAESSAPTAPEL